MSYTIKTNYADKSNYGSYRATSKIKYIVWHYTANDGDTDESNAKYFKTANIKTSAHYFVDDDSVTISVPDTYVAYSVGGDRYSNYKSTGGATLYNIATNSNTLNIELCDTVKNGKYDVSDKTLENAIQLTRELMKKYNIPISNVIRHFDVTGKSCPAYYVDNTKWNQVKQKISNSVVNNQSNSASTSVKTTSTPSTSTKLKVTSTVKAVQTWLNTYYKTGLSVDGIYGSKTKKALIKAWQKEVGGLTVDGIFGTKSKTTASKHNIKKGSSGILVTIWQAYLVCRGYNPNGIDGSFGSGCHAATVTFQKKNGLSQDGQVGKNTWSKAFS